MNYITGFKNSILRNVKCNYFEVPWMPFDFRGDDSFRTSVKVINNPYKHAHG